jgi:hypothetical protein
MQMRKRGTHPERAAAGRLARARNRLALDAARTLFRRPLSVRPAFPLISWDNDLGCHAFRHRYSWNTSPRIYEWAILQNRQALTEARPGASVPHFSLPLESAPRPGLKKAASKQGICALAELPEAAALPSSPGCEGPDVQLRFIRYQPALRPLHGKGQSRLQRCKYFDRSEYSCQGWLSFATHDVRDTPSPSGCTPDCFERVVQWSLDPGARILPVVKALEVIAGSPTKCVARRHAPARRWRPASDKTSVTTEARSAVCGVGYSLNHDDIACATGLNRDTG